MGIDVVMQNEDGEPEERFLDQEYNLATALRLPGLDSRVCLRFIDPYVVRYPSEVAQQMGVGTFVFRLGSIGMMALLAQVVTRLWPPPRFSVMRVFGQTSLLVYWVHVELVYGLLFKRQHFRHYRGWSPDMARDAMTDRGSS